jgi:hypothetical protein
MCIICYDKAMSGSGPVPQKSSESGCHLKRMGNDLHCTIPACKDREGFRDIGGFPNHAATVHDYGINIKFECATKRRRIDSNDMSSVSRASSRTSNSMVSGTLTLASSVGSDLLQKIDPQLLTVSESGGSV